MHRLQKEKRSYRKPPYLTLNYLIIQEETKMDKATERPSTKTLVNPNAPRAPLLVEPTPVDGVIGGRL